MRTPWQRLSEKVSILSVICSPACSESRSLGVEREVGGELHLKLNVCLRLTANKSCEGWKGSELDQCLVRLVHDAGIHVVCVVACIVRQDPSSHVNLTLWVGRAHFLCAITHLRIDIWTAFKRHVFEFTLHSCCSVLDVRS